MLTLLTNGLLAFVERLFGARAGWIDFKLSVLAGGWAALMIARPDIFDRGNFAGLNWLPDPVWIGLLVTLAVVHAIGFLRPGIRILRPLASAVSAWAWIFVAISLWRVEMGPGVINYAIVGVGALLGMIYLAGLPRGHG